MCRAGSGVAVDRDAPGKRQGKIISGEVMRLIEAFQAFWSVLTGKESSAPSVPPAVEPPSVPKPVEKPVKGDRFDEGAVYALALLQREGRLVDFLQEEIDGFEDAQIGAAVRQIHAGCRSVIRDHFSIGPILDGAEDSPCEVPADFDPCEIRLTGNVPDRAPYRGSLTHKGWIAGKVSLPQRSGAVNVRVVQSAEVSID
jgi:hypothetical protein